MRQRPEHLVHPSKGTEGSTEGTELLVRDRGGTLSGRFSKVEGLGARIGFILVLVTFALYLTGLIPPRIGIQEASSHLHRQVEDFSAQTGHPLGWEWLWHLDSSDTMSLAALVFLTSVIVYAYLAILPMLVRSRDWLYLGIVLVQIVVFLLAGSGLGGGH